MSDIPVFATKEVADEEDLVRPLGIMLVKGWSRCVAAHMVMVCCWQNEDFYKAWSGDNVALFVALFSISLMFDRACRRMSESSMPGQWSATQEKEKGERERQRERERESGRE